MNILILGATGLVGEALVKAFAATKAHQVIAISRRDFDFGLANVQTQVVDFENLESEITSICERHQIDVLCSALGTTKQDAGSIAKQRLVDYSYQFDVAKICSEQGVKHFVLVSSIGSDPKNKAPYLQMKGELEAAVEALCFEKIDIFQPSLLLGERDKLRVMESFGAKIMPWIAKIPGMYHYHPIHAGDLAKAICRCVLDDSQQALERQSKLKRYKYPQIESFVLKS